MSFFKELLFSGFSKRLRSLIIPFATALLSFISVLGMWLFGQAPDNTIGYTAAVFVTANAIYSLGYKNIENILREKIMKALS
jgi:hypothetical protein